MTNAQPHLQGDLLQGLELRNASRVAFDTQYWQSGGKSGGDEFRTEGGGSVHAQS